MRGIVSGRVVRLLARMLDAAHQQLDGPIVLGPLTQSGGGLCRPA